jgi:hypothetical protein
MLNDTTLRNVRPKDRAETPEEDLAATTGFVGFAACRLEDIKFSRVPFGMNAALGAAPGK